MEADGSEAGPPTCSANAVRAVVMAIPGKAALAVRIYDGFGRSSAYRVNDAADAAGLIESWASGGDDLGAGDAPTSPRRYARSIPPDAPVESVARRAHWIGSVDLATGRDRTTWYGSSITDCTELGVFCVGPRLRLARDDGFTGASQQYRIKRKSIDVMMVEAYPMFYRRLSLMPSAAFGFGWTRSRAAATARANAATADDLSFRAELSLMFGVRLTSSWSLGGEIGASYTPSSSTLSRTGSPAMPLPGPPTASVRAGVGFQLAL